MPTYDYKRAIEALRSKINPSFKNQILGVIRERHSLTLEHFSTGMQIRNALRQSQAFPPEEELPENFYDDMWMLLFIYALNITDEELANLSVETMLTAKQELDRWTGQTILAIYRDKIPLETLCEKQLEQSAEWYKNFKSGTFSLELS